ncbi:PAS domain S-box protein [Alteromonadaceae bacterium M269]|nr:PAS domain S-box protein [Alteromonadaceae bacterium M269]
MKISLQSQLVALLGLLIGLSIFSVLGFRYFKMQDLQTEVNLLSQASSEINHAQTMQEQWLTTLDLFLNDRQSYLAQGIDNQTKQLIKKYGEITAFANKTATSNNLEQLLSTINQGTQKLAFAKTQDEQQWNQFIIESDDLTEQLLDAADALSISIKEEYAQRETALSESQSQLVNLAFILLGVYLVTSITVGWWNSYTLVKPLEQLSHIAREGIKSSTDEDPKLKIDKGPTEIRQLSESLQHYSTGLKQQQRKTEKAHKEEQQTRQQLSTVMDTAPSAILSTDGAFNVLTLNPATEKIFGLKSENIIGQSLSRFIPALEQHKEEFSKLTDFQTRSIKGAKELPVEISSAEFHSNGKTQYLFMIRDVSRRVAQEKKMKNLNEQLVQSEKLASIGQLSAGVAHEINNPVGFVKSNIEVLSDYFDTFKDYMSAINKLSQSTSQEITEEQIQDLNDLKEELDIDYLVEDSLEIFGSSKDGLERVCKIVEEMKAFSHVEKDEQQPEDLANLIEQAVSLTANEVKYKADVQTVYGKLPKIQCWRTKLLQVLINLLVNASHAMKERGYIRVKTYQRDDNAIIEVLDNGCGISPENQKSIFAPFFTTKPVGQGTGLGLHVTQSIIAKHGGEISVKSKVGAGTCFTIVLPIAGVIAETSEDLGVL